MPGVFIIAGEHSGDFYGGRLAEELKRARPDLHIGGAGGEFMEKAGVEIHADLTKHAVIGATEAIGHLRELQRVFKLLVRKIEEMDPDVVVPIDYIEFNMRLAKMVRPLKIPVCYYVSPQIWAWRPWRIKTIARRVDRMLVLFDFEEEVYRKNGVDVAFVGHPLCDTLAPEGDFRIPRERGPSGECRVGLLPGSRIGEVKRLFPVMLSAAEQIARNVEGTEFTLGCTQGLPQGLVEEFQEKSPVPFEVVRGRAQEVMRQSELLLVTSGTACLEAGILQTPMAVLYKLGLGSLALFAMLKCIDTYAMPNILCKRQVVPEMMQWHCTPEKVASTALDLIQNKKLATMTEELAEVREHLGGSGASERAAREVLKFL
ncbi:MAG: lipid-A-disaccharide synthase [Planctomycetota bacterium]|nr:lipid-A-disaccharide synthase [Planctomycetota bacterium]MDP7252322.1 lipid-A-disaccharide synthase [Planctomycetota bacterium]